MSEINAPATLTTPAGSISFNPTSALTDYYWLTNVTGLDQAPLRTSTDPKPQAPGVIVHPSLRDARHITIEGMVVGQSGPSTRQTLCDSLQAALEAIETVDGTWAWTPSGHATRTVTVRCDVNVAFSGGLGGGPKNFIFGLIAANPAVS